MAALLAAAAALPALRLPFLADDWINLSTVARHQFFRTPFGYFRPLYLATYWLDWTIWGLTPFFFHVTSVILSALAAGLVVTAIRKYSEDDRLAILSGVLFALQPYHFHNVAWIAARGDTLCAVLILGSAISYHSWRGRPRGGAPWLWLAVAFFEASLLAKEAGAAFPVVLTMICLASRKQGERLRGLLPFYAVALMHFLVLRPWALQELGLSRLGGANLAWVWKLFGFTASALFPVPIDLLEARPLFWGGVAAVGGGSLLLLSRDALSKSGALLLLAATCFVLFLAPSLISFQERYFFLPSLPAAVALGALLTPLRPRFRAGALAVLLLVWLPCLAWQWLAWMQAGSASQALVDGLVVASHRPGVEEIALTNLPYRVGGPPVVGAFEEAIPLMGGRRVRVCAATSIDYPRAASEALDGPPGTAVRVTEASATVRLRIPTGVFSRLDDPHFAPGTVSASSLCGTVTLLQPGVFSAEVPRAADGTRAALYWNRGKFVSLF